MDAVHNDEEKALGLFLGVPLVLAFLLSAVIVIGAAVDVIYQALTGQTLFPHA